MSRKSPMIVTSCNSRLEIAHRKRIMLNQEVKKYAFPLEMHSSIKNRNFIIPSKSHHNTIKKN
jgi:hypothetical protein